MRLLRIGDAAPQDHPRELCYPIRRTRMSVRVNMHERSREVRGWPEGIPRSPHGTAPGRSGARASCPWGIPKIRAWNPVTAGRSRKPAGGTALGSAMPALRWPQGARACPRRSIRSTTSAPPRAATSANGIARMPTLRKRVADTSRRLLGIRRALSPLARCLGLASARKSSDRRHENPENDGHPRGPGRDRRRVYSPEPR